MHREPILVSGEVWAAMEAYVAAPDDDLAAALDVLRAKTTGTVQFIIVAVIQTARRDGQRSVPPGMFVNYGEVHLGTRVENSGQMQGVGIHGTGAATNATQQQTPAGAAADDVGALREQVGELFTLVAKRLEDLEATAPPPGTADLLRELMVSLKDVDSANTKTLEDIRQMLEQLWGDAMREKFDKLDQFLKASGKALPALARLLSLAGGAS